MKINFHKSVLYCFGSARDKVDEYSSIFTCGVGKIPFKYFGIPMDCVRLSNSDWGEAEGKVDYILGLENKIPIGVD